MPDDALAIVQAHCSPFSGAVTAARSHTSSLLRLEDVRRADLILGMTRHHRRQAVELVPARLRSSFTLREFARLASALDSETVVSELRGISGHRERLRGAIALLGAVRGRVEPPDDPVEDDVIDPYRQSSAVYRRSAAELVPALDQVVRVVRLVVNSGSE